MEQTKNPLSGKSGTGVQGDDRALAERGITRPGPAMFKRESYAKPVAEAGLEQKVRECLVCRTPFPSAWAGERICHRCKSTSAWRSGVIK